MRNRPPWLLNRPISREEIFDIEDELIEEADIHQHVLRSLRGRERIDYISRHIEQAGLVAVIVRTRLLPVIIKNENRRRLFAIRLKDMDKLRRFLERHHASLLKERNVVPFRPVNKAS